MEFITTDQSPGPGPAYPGTNLELFIQPTAVIETTMTTMMFKHFSRFLSSKIGLKKKLKLLYYDSLISLLSI